MKEFLLIQAAVFDDKVFNEYRISSRVRMIYKWVVGVDMIFIWYFFEYPVNVNEGNIYNVIPQ